MPHGFSTQVTLTSFSSRHQINPLPFEFEGPSRGGSKPSLVRPSTSKARPRPGTANTNTSNSSLSTPPPFGSRPVVSRANTLDVRVEPNPTSFLPPIDTEPIWNEELKRWEQSDRAFGTQRAVLRHTQSIPRLSPLQPQKPLPILPCPTTIETKEAELPSWMAGKAELQILGQGGTSGAELKVFLGKQTQPAIKHFIPPINHTDSADYFNPTGYTQFLEITDVRIEHHSVFAKHHVLSVRIPSTSVMQQIPKITSFDFEEGPKKQKSSTLSILGLKSKKDTLKTAPSQTTISSTGTEDVHDQVIYLCFPSEQDQGDWYSLLRSFCRVPTGFRLHRRLELKVFDLHELPIADSASTLGRANHEGDLKGLRPGWVEKEKVCVEVIVDDTLIGRTTWQKAEENKTMPFWGETLSFEELPDFAACLLRLHRQVRGQPVLFATVELPLSSSFARPRDDRYQVRSIDGVIIGELRMSVLFNEVAIQPRKDYGMESLLAGEPGVRLLYYLSARGQLDGTPDLFARIGLADGSNLPRLLAMCRLESQANAETLFRSNTPLSRLLEACLRLRCRTFLRHSVGAVIRRVFNEKTRSRIPDDGAKLSYESLQIMLDLAKMCFQDMYLQRNHFPNFLRQVFAKLFQSVKDSHPLPGEEKLRYKALSSFLFLRLIGPALMRPHLFGLCDGLPTPSAQRTLTLLAKILNALAFFTPRDMQRDDELAMFSKFISENTETMVDYLASFATPLDKFQCLAVTTTPICNFLKDRLAILPPSQAESVPQLTSAGPIDAAADIAILAETLYERRQDGPTYPLSYLDQEALAEENARELDVVLKRVHQRAIELAGSEAADSENRVLRSSFSFDSTFSEIQTPPSISSTRRKAPPGVWKWASLSLSLPTASPPRKSYSPPHSPLPLGSVKQIINVPYDQY